MGELTMEHMKIGYIYGLLEDYQDKPWIFSVECDVDSQHYEQLIHIENNLE